MTSENWVRPTRAPWYHGSTANDGWIRVPPPVIPQAGDSRTRPVVFYTGKDCPKCGCRRSRRIGAQRWKDAEYRICRGCGARYDAIRVRRTESPQ